MQIYLGWVIALSCAVGIIATTAAYLLLVSRRRITRLKSELQKRTDELKVQVGKAKEATKAKSDFLSQMSHEIRTPLNAIMGMVQIARNTTNDHRVEDCMRKTELSIKHLLGIVNDILDLSKIESGKLTFEENLFSLTNELNFIASMFKSKAEEKNISLQIDVKNISHDGITTDKIRLNQVLINLMSNAVKFTDNNGSIVLSVDELFHMNGESAYRFSVKDDGIGIKPDQAKKLFTPFTQANVGVFRLYGGTGLGLAISQNIVQMMGGDIELETEYGKGSIFMFTIRVPAVEHAEEKTEEEQQHTLRDSLRGKRIMVVDDIDINREVVELLLESSGALIDSVTNGKEAFDAYLRAEPYWYDLILMDMQMPIMDGCAATEEIRNSGKKDAKDIKIIAMTANVLREDAERAYQSGMNAYLTKPIELSALYAEMEEWL